MANIPCAKFISLTYGASGSKQERSINFARYLISYNPALASKIALHITCIGKSTNDILKIVEEFYNLGIRQFVAVRGDGEIPENAFGIFVCTNGCHYLLEYDDDGKLID